jgi:hypothetical protein
MASTLKFNSDRREMRRERHDARVARKRERQQARQLKHAQQLDAVRLQPAIERSTPAPVLGPAPTARVSVLEPAPTAPVTTAPLETTALPEQPPVPHAPRTEEHTPFVAQRERDVAAFLARREEVIAAARAEAQERIERMGEERAVADALGALAHSGAAPWRRHRERLAEAITTGRIPVVGACARRGCRGAASDAARTSRRAPDPELALAIAVAYAVIAQAPWSAVRGARAERAGAPSPARPGWRRAFWR